MAPPIVDLSTKGHNGSNLPIIILRCQINVHSANTFLTSKKRTTSLQRAK